VAITRLLPDNKITALFAHEKVDQKGSAKKT